MDVNQAQKKSPPVRFTTQELEYVAEAINGNGGRADYDFLDVVAKQCNIHFHEKKKLRNGNSLWWYISRKKKQGDEMFANISIPKGSPKGTRVSGGVPATPKPRPVVAAKPQTPILPPKPGRTLEQQRIASAVKPEKNGKGAGTPLTVLVQAPDGTISKCVVTKFGSLEELLFALA